MSGRVLAVTAASKDLADRVSPLAPDGAVVLVIDAAVGSAGWAEAVEDGSRSLLTLLGDELADGGAPLVVVLGASEPASLIGAALDAAVRGTVGVAALESAPSQRRVNTVVVGATTDPADIAATLTYLANEEAAGFTTGATIDLTRTSSRAEPGDLPVLVTGAAGGLGSAVAEAFIAAGRPVILSDLPGESLDRQAERLDAPAIGCDVTSESDVAALAAHALLADGLSSLQVIHGVGGSGAIVGLAERPREMSLRINGTGAHQVVAALLPAVERARGSVVVLSSQAGLISEAGNGAYCAAKFAAVALVRSLADTAPEGVRVHTLCPGPIDTPLMRTAFAGMAEAEGITYEDYHASRLALIPLGRFGAPEHMGHGAVLLDGLAATGVTLAPTGAFLLT